MKVLIDCVQTGSEIIKTFASRIDLVVTVKPEFAKKNNLSGYVDHRKLCKKHNIPIYHPEKFNLSGIKDLKYFKKIKPDLIMVFGWQRIIPDEIIKTSKVVVGNHGSWRKLPKGRGHSPINWALIKDKKKFYAHLFYLNTGVDSGDIIDCIKFNINKFDTCDSLYKKGAMVLTKMLQRKWYSILDKNPGKKQTGTPTYLPKRIPKDGRINVNMATKEVYNLVRGVTKPYPGAFINKNKKKIIIWKCQPFDVGIAKRNDNTFEDGTFLLFTKDGSVLVTDWEIEK